MKYVPPGLPGSIVSVKPRYENFIGGKWLAPTHGKYRLDLAPATAGPITEVAHSTPEDVELALDAAHAAKDAWGEASATVRAEVLNAIADAVEKNKDMLAVTTFTDDADALAIANDTLYGLGAGVWTRDGTRAYKMGRGIKAGRVWTNCYHQYPAGASFGGYKISGIGRKNHRMMLDHYSQTKNLLVSYSTKPLGLF
jgi:acyl-CoA reductase-like NAD-dependent aldehyde dehydrogenase